MGWLARSFGEKKLSIAGVLLMIAAFFVLPLSSTAAVLLLATASASLGHGLLASPLNAVASKSLGADSQGRALGLMQTSASLARIVGPIAGGWLLGLDAARRGVPYGRSPYWAAGVVMLAALAITATLRVPRDGS